MKLACPSCHQELDVLAVDERLCADVTCGHCGAVIGISVTATIVQAGASASAGATPKVAVVMQDAQMRAAYVAALQAAGYQVIESGDARQALEALGQNVPQLAVIDGGFEPVFGMGMGEILKKSNVTRDTKILGLHPDPSTALPVPGADHTMPAVAGADAVVNAVDALLSGNPPAPAQPAAPQPAMETPQMAPAQPEAPAMQEPLVQPAPPEEPVMQQPAMTPEQPAAQAAPADGGAAGASASGGGATAAISKPVPDDPEHAKAQRLARTIISDIALYNEEAVQDGIQNGNLREAVEPFLDEGREHYREKVSDEILNSTNYFDEALDAWIARKTGAAV